MHIERFFVPGLAHASYLIASGDEAAVIDPERNVGGYIAYLARNRLKLKAIILTHPHADFVAGHAELAARSGASIYISEKAPATFVHHDLKEGDRLALGEVELEVIDTPGHSPDSICLSVLESGQPVALFSGDTLFAGDVGRPDCAMGKWVRMNSRRCSTIHSSTSCSSSRPGLKFTPATALDRSVEDRFRLRPSRRLDRKRPPTGHSN
jgi:glyoxylase-like metal-dependent hydrolase (beta-lactamase superfamily II)